MDNARVLVEAQGVVSDRGLDHAVSAVCGVPGVDDTAAPQGIAPMIVALVILASVLSGFFVGYVLGPAAFMVMR